MQAEQTAGLIISLVRQVSIAEPETVGIPGIIHSTFLRFARSTLLPGSPDFGTHTYTHTHTHTHTHTPQSPLHPVCMSVP